MLQTSTKQISLTLKQLQTLIPSPVSVFFLSLQLYKAKKADHHVTKKQQKCEYPLS